MNRNIIIGLCIGLVIVIIVVLILWCPCCKKDDTEWENMVKLMPEESKSCMGNVLFEKEWMVKNWEKVLSMLKKGSMPPKDMWDKMNPKWTQKKSDNLIKVVTKWGQKQS